MTLGNNNGTDGQTDGQTDRQTDRQSATKYAAPSYGGGPHNKCYGQFRLPHRNKWHFHITRRLIMLGKKEATLYHNMIKRRDEYEIVMKCYSV